MVQVQGVERADDPLCHPAGQDGGQGRGQYSNDENGLEHPQHQGQLGGLTGGDPQHRAAVQSAGIVQRPLRQGVRVAHAAALSAEERLPYLNAAPVVFHLLHGDVGVKEHRPVGAHPGQPVVGASAPAGILGGQPFQVVLPAGLHPAGRQPQLVPQLAFLHVPEIVVQAAQHNHQAGRQHRRGHHQGGSKNFPCHGVASSR